MTEHYEITHNFKKAIEKAIEAEIRTSNEQLIKRIFLDQMDQRESPQPMPTYESMLARYLPPLDMNDADERAPGTQSGNTPLPTSSGKILNKLTIDGKNIYAEEDAGGSVFDENNNKLDMTVAIHNGSNVYVEKKDGGSIFDSAGKHVGTVKNGKYVFD